MYIHTYIYQHTYIKTYIHACTYCTNINIMIKTLHIYQYDITSIKFHENKHFLNNYGIKKAY